MINAKIKKFIFFGVSIFMYPFFSYASVDTYPAFQVNGFLTKNGTLLVNEEFIFDFGENARHGVIRTMPLVSDSGKRWYELNNINIKNKDSQNIPFESQVSGNTATLKIGDANLILTGTHYYNLKYTVSNIGSNTEINWRVLNPLREPIGKFKANLYFPALIRKDVATATCTFTPSRLSGDCNLTPILKEDRILGYTLEAENINNREIHINAKYPNGVVVSNYVEKDNTIHYKKYIVIIAPILFLLLISFFVYKYRRKIRDTYKYLAKHSISPDHYSYLERAYYYNKEIKKEDIVATVADLSERGFISLDQYAHPVGAHEFIDYSVEILTDENENESEKLLIDSLQNVTSLAEWLSNNYNDLKPKLEEFASKSTVDIKLYRKDIEDIPQLVGFKIL